MRFKVYLLRVQGQRQKWRDVTNGPSCIGDLISYYITVAGDRYRVLSCRPDLPMDDELVPRLYEPVLLGFSPLAFRLRGFERIEEEGVAFGVVQEWHCEYASVLAS